MIVKVVVAVIVDRGAVAVVALVQIVRGKVPKSPRRINVHLKNRKSLQRDKSKRLQCSWSKNLYQFISIANNSSN